MAARLNAASAFPARLPPLALMTDDERLSDPIAAARALPRGSLVIVRARDEERRAALAAGVMAVARTRLLVVLIAGDAALAARTGADGLHLSAAQAHELPHWRACHPRFLVTSAAHSLNEVMRASHLGADAVFLSPVFPTRSHPDRAPLTDARANFIARSVRMPVYALGGVTEENAGRLANGFSGIAAIGALAV